MPPDSTRQLRRNARATLLAYLVAGLFPIVVVVVRDGLLSRDITQPISYLGGDALGAIAGAKNLIDTGWSFHARFLGAPGQADFYDYPQCDFLNVLLLKILTLITHNPVVSVTLFYVVSFPLCAWTALWAFRHIGISTPAATVCAALYTLLPYHFYRGQVHLFLDNYAMIPPVALIAVWLATGVSFDGDPPATKRRRMAALIVFATVCTGVYYGFFGAFIIAIGGLLGGVRGRSWEPLKSATLFLMVAVLALVLNLAPTMWYRLENGPNSDVGGRRLDEAEIFSLRLTYLLLPNDSHEIAALSAITRNYQKQLATGFEARSEALGFLGSAGFLVLLAVIFLAAAGRSPANPNAPPNQLAPHELTLGILASLNLACILLATTAAVGSLIAFYISPVIRSYNRISVVIAFLSLGAVAVLIDRFILRPLNTRGRGAAGLFILTALLIVATLDEVPLPPSDRPQQLRDYARDARLVASIEKSVPAGSMIFQLPYLPYPEAGFVGHVEDYDPFRGYIHSTDLRWSYGAMRNRPQDKIDKDLAALPPVDMVPKLRALGFAGIWLDLYGYDLAQWPALVSAYSSATNDSTPLYSDDADHRFFFFKIAP